MSTTKAISLNEAILGHGEPITQVVVRPPRLLEYAEIGEPFTWERNPDGGAPVYVEHDGAIARYMRLCIVEPADKLVIESQASLVDAMRIKEAILDFFYEARRALISLPSPTSSSSTAG